ncbi:MAG: hypothetical protein AB1896_19205 [Thermodesulfobacteriota bacterium]
MAEAVSTTYTPDPWWKSKRFWGGVVGLLGFVAGLLGYSFSEADQETVLTLVIGLVSAGSGLLAFVSKKMESKKLAQGGQ